MSWLDKTVLRMREEYVRLTGLSLSVPTDEQIAQREANARAGGYNPRKPTVALVFEVEPLSYRIEGGKIGNRRLIYVDISRGLEQADLEKVRAFGLNGLADDLLVRQNPQNSPEEQGDTNARFLRHFTVAGGDLSVDPAGQPITNDIGTVFKCLEGSASFPARVQGSDGRWRNSGRYNRFARYLVEKAPDYVAPENPRVVEVTSRDEDGHEAAAPAAANGSTGGINWKDVAARAGLVGQAAASFATPAQQLGFISNAVALAPELLTDASNNAAMEGKLLDFLAERGAIAISDGVVIGVE